MVVKQAGRVRRQEIVFRAVSSDFGQSFAGFSVSAMHQKVRSARARESNVGVRFIYFQRDGKGKMRRHLLSTVPGFFQRATAAAHGRVWPVWRWFHRHTDPDTSSREREVRGKRLGRARASDRVDDFWSK